jgi:hypothetical protein
MPSSDAILSGLTDLANTWQWVAVVFHVYLAILVILLVAGVRPSKRLFGILLAIPPASVSALAWSSTNPFNGSLFAILAVLLIIFSLRLPAEAVRTAPAPVTVVGAVLLAFGWVYPHFLDTGSFLTYLYAAPVGIVPCPTLSAVLGLALIVDSFQSRAWGIAAGAAGLLYGVFGALRLGVALDWALVAGAAALFVYAVALKAADRGKSGPGLKNGGT